MNLPGNGLSSGNPGSNGVAANAGKTETPSATESGCAIGPAGAGGSDVDMAVAGLVGLAFARARKKKR